MSQKWVEAARKYREAETEKERTRTGQRAAKQQDIKYQADSWRLQAANIADVARELERFMTSDDGRAAKELLASSKRHINFGVEVEVGFATVIFVDGAGLQVSYEPHGTWITYANILPRPRISPIKPIAAVQAAVWQRRLRPEDVMPWLCGELDKIADAAK